jgi:hypothetical protein
MRGVRRLGEGAILLVVALAGLLGCQPSYNHLRPPKAAEDYTPPPKDDLRFSQPVEYPKNTLNSDNLIRPKDSTTPMGPGGPGGAGMGAPRGSMGGSPGGGRPY